MKREIIATTVEKEVKHFLIKEGINRGLKLSEYVRQILTNMFLENNENKDK